MRVDIADRGVVAAVHAVRDALADLLVHEHAPLALAQRTAALPAGTPLFTSLFNYRHNPEAAPGTADPFDEIKILGREERTNYPLVVSVNDTGSGFTFTVQAVTPIDLHAVAAMLRTATEGLVAALDEAPDMRVSALSVLDEGELDRVLRAWNDTATATPPGTVPDLFAAQVARTPDAVALVGEGVELTYAELDARADRLAHSLAGFGVRPGVGRCRGAAAVRRADRGAAGGVEGGRCVSCRWT